MTLAILSKFSEGRKKIIELTAKHIANNWQGNNTPYEIVERMIAKTPVRNKSILILFNLEFLEHLIYDTKIEPDHITFVADTPQEKMIAEKIYNVNSILITEEEFKNNKLSGITNMKFDLVFSNPPYNRGIDLKILEEIKTFANEIDGLCVLLCT